MINIDQKTFDTVRQRGKDSLYFFAKAILGFEDLTDHIHKPICDELQDDENKRIMIILPRDWFKSSIGSIAYPIWRAINNPNIRILVVQNTMTNACKKLSSIKAMIESNELLKSLYSKLRPSKNSKWTQDVLTIERTGTYPEGTFEAAGTGTASTSRHFDLIIQDDTVSPSIDDMTGITQQPTQMEIEKAIGFHRLTSPLLLHPKKSKVVVIGTRWAERDLIGWIEINQPEYKVLSRSARENGEYVWDRFDESVLKELEHAVGPYMFSTLYMNEPLSGIDTLFKRTWIRYYQTMPKTSNLSFCSSIDPASAETDGSSDPDYTVVLTSAIDRVTGQIYVVHYTRRRMNAGEQVDAMFDHYGAYKPLVFKVEAIGYQRTLIHWVQKRQNETGQVFYIDPIKSHKVSKVDRVRGLQPYFAGHMIMIKSDMGELERELLSFPNAAHDDIVDALSMHIKFWYQECSMSNQDEQTKLENNPLSGASIMDEFLGRSRMRNRYPYDMGINGHGLDERIYREVI